MDWSHLPDLVAIVMLACAFASVGKRCPNPASGVWLTAWTVIGLHFAANLFSPLPGFVGHVAVFIGMGCIAWAGALFLWASVPFRSNRSSRSMLAVLLALNSLYPAILTAGPAAYWAMTPAAVLMGLGPVAVALLALPRINHPVRWITVAVYASLAVFLLAAQSPSETGTFVAINSVFFAVYLDCSIQFAYTYRRPTTGVFITIAGFITWATVFVVGPVMIVRFPAVHVESEIWNLPKYVVAIGMILLLLEEQIERNKYLALHDELTGLPNRRLFQDRLDGALERARRNRTQAALLVIDLNDFKQVNDTAGHHVGDLLLRSVAEIFSGRMRRSDTVARTGGDEFTIIVEEPAGSEEAWKLGRSLVGLLDRPFRLGGHFIRIGASMGAAVYPQDASAAEALHIVADQRMYADKRAHQAGAALEPELVHLAKADTAIEPEFAK